MESLESINRGEYNTSFFSLFVNTKEQLFDNEGNFNHNLNEKDKGTFIHEYIHYIQNIATTFGLIEIIITYDLLEEVISHIKKYVGTEIKLPIPLTSLNPIIVEKFNRFHLHKVSYVRSDNSGNLNYFDELKFNYIDKTHQGTTQKCLEVKSFYNGQEVETFIFGTNCIKESMAHLIQRLIDPDTDNYPHHFDIPYKSAEIIIQYIYPELIDDDKLNIIVLCYYSLSIPASSTGENLFYEILKYLKEHKYTFQSPIDFYNYLYYNFSKYINISSHNETLSSLFDKYLKEAFKYLKEVLLKIKENSGLENIEWFYEVLNNVLYYQNNLPTQLIHLISSIKKDTNRVISELIKIYRIPHIYTNNHSEIHDFLREHVDYVQNNDLLLLSAVSPVLNNLIGKQGCSRHLKYLCQKVDGMYEENLCNNEPWERINQNCPECPFTKLWKNVIGEKKIILK